uniref:Uncharacterized protein n=1 Tax=Neobodo designis TaxID=312471 RepID=A0A7S1LE86_NEODS|mmetsp:Transcript_20396/g.63385  ORF Transcript_20396/g.63385 Transcript_20396/m.63385 type:complete len:369 (+) Transcript_20396:211-1317(+)
MGCANSAEAPSSEAVAKDAQNGPSPHDGSAEDRAGVSCDQLTRSVPATAANPLAASSVGGPTTAPDPNDEAHGSCRSPATRHDAAADFTSLKSYCPDTERANNNGPAAVPSNGTPAEGTRSAALPPLPGGGASSYGAASQRSSSKPGRRRPNGAPGRGSSDASDPNDDARSAGGMGLFELAGSNGDAASANGGSRQNVSSRAPPAPQRSFATMATAGMGGRSAFNGTGRGGSAANVASHTYSAIFASGTAGRLPSTNNARQSASGGGGGTSVFRQNPFAALATGEFQEAGAEGPPSLFTTANVAQIASVAERSFDQRVQEWVDDVAGATTPEPLVDESDSDGVEKRRRSPRERDTKDPLAQPCFTLAE